MEGMHGGHTGDTQATRRGHAGDTLTIGSVRSEGNDDLESLVSVLDGGQGEEGVRRLPEIGDQVLCGDTGVRRGVGTSPPTLPVCLSIRLSSPRTLRT